MSAIGSPWKGHVTAKDEGNTDENLSARHPYSTKQVGLTRVGHTGFGLDFETAPIIHSSAPITRGSWLVPAVPTPGVRLLGFICQLWCE